MNLLTDQDVYHSTILLLKEWKHNVLTASELGMSRSKDDIMRFKVIITYDKEYEGYVIDVHELVGCMSQGKTLAELKFG